MDYYSHTNQKIMIGHFPGETKRIETELIQDLKTRRFNKPDDITFVCPFSYDARDVAVLIDQLELNKYDYVNSLKDRASNWNRVDKIINVLDSLKLSTTKYSLILDTNDVVILSDLTDIIDRFNEYKEEFPDLKILYNATIWMHPHIIVDEVPDRYKYGDFCWLNAGCAICETEYAIEFYEETYKELRKDIITHRPVESEQYYIRKIFDKHQDKVFFDYKCSIFQCWHKQEYRYDGDKCYLL